MQKKFYILFPKLRLTNTPGLPGATPVNTFYPTKLLIRSPFTLKSDLERVQTMHLMAILALTKPREVLNQ